MIVANQIIKHYSRSSYYRAMKFCDLVSIHFCVSAFSVDTAVLKLRLHLNIKIHIVLDACSVQVEAKQVEVPCSLSQRPTLHTLSGNVRHL